MYCKWPTYFMQLTPNEESEHEVSKLFNNYLSDNPESGYVIFQIVENSPIKGLTPISNAKITISKSIGNGYFISKVVTTDVDGKTEPVALLTVEAYHSLLPDDSRSYSTYNATIEAYNYLTTDVYNINIFDNITSIQTVQLLPQVDNCNARQFYNADPQNLCERW